MSEHSTRGVRPLPFLLVALAALVVIVLVIRELKAGGPGTTAPDEIRPVTRFADDFSSRAGWPTFSSESAEMNYHDGGYRLRLFRPGDDGLSVVVLPGKGWPSVAATAAVEARSPLGGLVGVGCTAGKDRAYLGAVDPATGGVVILRSSRSDLSLLRYGASEEGTLRPVPESNELQIQCRVRTMPAPSTSVRLFANGNLLAAYEDRGGLGPFNGVALGGVSLHKPLEAVFRRASFQVLSAVRASPDSTATACDHLLVAGSLQEDYRWLVDSGGTRLNTMDFDSRQVGRIARELGRISSSLQSDARAPGTGDEGRRSLRDLAERFRRQGEALNSLTNAVNRGAADTIVASSALSCPQPELLLSPNRAPIGPIGVPARARPAHRSGAARELDERLTRILPTPVFVSDDATLPFEPDLPVGVDLRYHSFRVFGESIAEVNESLRVNAIHVENELAAGLTTSRFESSYSPLPGPSGCILVPEVSLELVITLPDWRPPPDADRYLRNQWNQFMWDLDAHERHHAELWIKAANRMAIAINATPPGVSCQQAVSVAKARINRIFKRFDRMQRKFDADVASGKLPAPSLP
jgi:predicted secreted Zn-dependent protease